MAYAAVVAGGLVVALLGCQKAHPPSPPRSPAAVEAALIMAAKAPALSSSPVAAPAPAAVAKPAASAEAAASGSKREPPKSEGERGTVATSEIRATLLRLLPDNKTQSISDLVINLVCVGEKPKDEEIMQTACESELVITQEQDGTRRELVRTKDVPGIDPEMRTLRKYAIELQTLELSDLGGSLLVVRRTRDDMEIDPTMASPRPAARSQRLRLVTTASLRRSIWARTDAATATAASGADSCCPMGEATTNQRCLPSRLRSAPLRCGRRRARLAAPCA